MSKEPSKVVVAIIYIYPCELVHTPPPQNCCPQNFFSRRRESERKKGKPLRRVNLVPLLLLLLLMKAITCTRGDDDFPVWSDLLTCNWNLFGSPVMNKCRQVLMGMRPLTGEQFDTTISITSLIHPRIGEPVELPVIFSGGSYNLSSFVSVFFSFSCHVGRAGPGRVGRAPVF